MVTINLRDITCGLIALLFVFSLQSTAVAYDGIKFETNQKQISKNRHSKSKKIAKRRFHKTSRKTARKTLRKRGRARLRVNRVRANKARAHKGLTKREIRRLERKARRLERRKKRAERRRVRRLQRENRRLAFTRVDTVQQKRRSVRKSVKRRSVSRPVRKSAKRKTVRRVVKPRVKKRGLRKVAVRKSSKRRVYRKKRANKKRRKFKRIVAGTRNKAIKRRVVGKRNANIASKHVPKKKRVASGQSRFSSLIAKHAAAFGVPVKLAKAVVRVESNFRPHVRGGAGEIGLMQIKPATARAMGFRGPTRALFNPDTNIKYGMKYLAGAYRRAGGSLCGTILRYNAGHYAKRMNPISARYCRKVKRILGKRGDTRL